MKNIVRVHTNDLPNLENYKVDSIAIDTETMGLKIGRDRLCLVQLSPGNGTADIIKIEKGVHEAPNLVKLLNDDKIVKIFHYARFDIAALAMQFDIILENAFCTKIASYLVRTYSSRHGLKDLCNELLGVQISKQQQCSDWGIEKLTSAQVDYAVSDVLYLHKLRKILIEKLLREDRLHIAQACFDFLPVRALLDIEGWENQDIFAHS